MKYFIVIILILTGIVFGIFTVDNRENAVVTFMNKTQKLYLPGTHITVPGFSRIDYIYIGNRYSLLEVPQVLTTKDEIKINLSLLINWHVTNPINYLNATKQFNEVELNYKIAQSVIKNINNVVMNTMLLNLNQINSLNKQAINLAQYGLSIDQITIESLHYSILDKKLDKNDLHKSSKLLDSTNLIDSSIESAYLQAQAIKTETEIEEAKLYNQIKNKDPKFYNYFRTIDIYTRTAKTKGDIPPLKKLYN